MITAVSFHSLFCIKRLINPATNFCSSSGEEYPAWPSCAPFALIKLAAGNLSSRSAVKKSLRSY